MIPFLAGILAFLSPCIIPMVSLYLSLITGLSLEELLAAETSQVKKDLVVNTLIFVAGFTVIYLAVGFLAGSLGQFLTKNQTLLNHIGGAFLIVLGLQLVGVVHKFNFFSLKLKPTSLLKSFNYGGYRSFSAGVVFAVACSHCFSGLIGSVLILAGLSGSGQQGGLSLLLFSLGLGIPFLLTALVLSRSLEYLKRWQRHIQLVPKVSGAFLILFGLLVFFNRYYDVTNMIGKLYG